MEIVNGAGLKPRETLEYLSEVLIELCNICPANKKCPIKGINGKALKVDLQIPDEKMIALIADRANDAVRMELANLVLKQVPEELMITAFMKASHVNKNAEESFAKFIASKRKEEKEKVEIKVEDG